MPQPIASASYDWENPPLGLGAQTTYDLNGSLATEPFHEPDGSHDDQDIRLQWPGPPVDLPGYGTEPDFPGGGPHRAPQREPVTARGSLTARKVDHLINEADYLYAQKRRSGEAPGRSNNPFGTHRVRSRSSSSRGGSSEASTDVRPSCFALRRPFARNHLSARDFSNGRGPGIVRTTDQPFENRAATAKARRSVRRGTERFHVRRSYLPAHGRRRRPP